MLISISVLLIISTLAFFGISNLRDAMAIGAAEQELQGYLARARADGIRRHDSTSVQVQFSGANSTSYTVTMDSDGNGTVDNARTVTL